jgi:hypothetical protein
VRFVLAFAVIGDHLDYPTLADAAVSAFVYHSSELRPKGVETTYAVFDLVEVTAGNAIGLVTGLLRLTGQPQKLADILDLESELTGVANEIEAPNLCRAIAPLLPFSAKRRRKKPDLLIVANCRHFHGGSLRQIADRQIHAVALLKL